MKNENNGRKTLSTVQEATNETKSSGSITNSTDKNNQKIEDSIIPKRYDEENNNLMSFYGVNNDIESIVNNLQYNETMKQNISILVDDYLEVFEFDKVSIEQIMKIIQTVNQTDLQDAKKVMEILEYDGKMISKISGINFLLYKAKDIDNKDMDEIIKKMEEKPNDLFAWRDILPGPDSFFRAVMFSFLEDTILSRNINNYRAFLYEINKNIEDNYFKRILSFYKIECLKSKIIFILIYYALTIQDTEVSIEKAHSLFIKTYNFDTNFDLLLILNLKFLIYKYLRSNENKLYTREYSIPVRSLLPSRYQTRNKNYNFKDFYEKNLLQLNKEAERITISVIPFILGKDLFIYSFEQKNLASFHIHTDDLFLQNGIVRIHRILE